MRTITPRASGRRGGITKTPSGGSRFGIIPPPPAPPGGTVNKTLRWNEVFGAQDYVVEVGTSPGAKNFLEVAIGSTTPQYLINNLVIGTTYYIRVRSVAANGGTGIANSGPPSAELPYLAQP